MDKKEKNIEMERKISSRFFSYSFSCSIIINQKMAENTSAEKT
jgi:hypothetical protein